MSVGRKSADDVIRVGSLGPKAVLPVLDCAKEPVLTTARWDHRLRRFRLALLHLRQVVDP